MVQQVNASLYQCCEYHSDSMISVLCTFCFYINNLIKLVTKDSYIFVQNVLACSIADLESEPGLFTSIKEVIKYFSWISTAFLGNSVWFRIIAPLWELTIEIQLYNFSLWQKVFSEAEKMAKKYRKKLPAVPKARKLETFPSDALPFENEGDLYSNWKWFKFEKDKELKWAFVSY